MAAIATQIDFSQTDLAKAYTGFYAKIIDNVFSPAECAELIETASKSGGYGFRPATMMAGESHETVHSDFRISDQALVVDKEIASKIFERLKSFVEADIGAIEPTGKWGTITGKEGRKEGPTWVLKRVHPRLSFLRYGPGHFFKQHCDGLVDVNEDGHGAQKSFVTLHLYLNDASTEGNERMEGGATRFWAPNKKAWLDVEPKVGRVLVFQQRKLIHAGEEVKGGIKYTMRSDFLFEAA